MNIMAVLVPILAIGGLGLLFGIGLGIAAKKFAVPVDERVVAVRECLPGANCGGCGFAGCDALAKAIVALESGVSSCPVCSAEQVAAISQVMGQEESQLEKFIAVVRCKGSSLLAKEKYQYEGIRTCEDAQGIGGGPKICKFGCLGYGTCAIECPFGAIQMKDGLPMISRELCVGCGVCTKSCPRQIIHLLPVSSSFHVNCVSQDKGREVKLACQVGCIGCGICAKQCEAQAITVKALHAEIDPMLCTGCGKCAAKCPTQAISNLLDEMQEEVKVPSVPLPVPKQPNIPL